MFVCNPVQNPPDCGKAHKLVCNINKGCGYGCQLHHVVYCFMIAYGTQRTLILESQNWRYATGGWETVFKPVSDTCTDRSGASTGHWSGKYLVHSHQQLLGFFLDFKAENFTHVQCKHLAHYLHTL